MEIVAVIQARMGSSRLPGKVIKDILGKPMLWYLVNRVKGSDLINTIVIASSKKDIDKPILALAEDMGINSFAGSEEDVLDRCYQAAKTYNADIIVRITADCPLIDPELVDKVIRYYLENREALDFVHSGSSYPDGVVETAVFPFTVLEKTWQEARLASEREHVTPYIWNNTQLFRIGTVEHSEDLSNIRLVVDDERDFQLVSEIFHELYKRDEIFHLEELLDFLKSRPELLELNKRTVRNEGYLKSIKEDRIVK